MPFSTATRSLRYERQTWLLHCNTFSGLRACKGVRMKVSELQGAALDWAVAKCEGFVDRLDLTPWEFLRYREDHGYEPSTDWVQGGPIIEREKVAIYWREYFDEPPEESYWVATIDKPLTETQGQTPLIAAMRCYVASKLGEEVEIPEELK